nr:hypothetical protein [uncultured Chryseobacterium sp.]
MSIPLNTIYSYFETGDFPTQEQFQASWSSFWHKDESIPTSKVTGLETQLQNKTDKSIFETHVSDPDAHAGYLAKKDASNLNNTHVQAWKTALGVGDLPSNIATLDEGNKYGNVYSKDQSNDRFLTFNDYVNEDRKILAEKIEALGLTTLVEVKENSLIDFTKNSAAYEFEDNDFIAIPDSNGNFALYMFKGGDKTDIKNYLPTGISNVTIGMVEGLQAALNEKVNKPSKDGKFYIKREAGITTTEAVKDTILIEAKETSLTSFIDHIDAYQFEDHDFIAIPNTKGSFALYLFKGGKKSVVENYIPTNTSEVTVEMLENMQALLTQTISDKVNGKVSIPSTDGKFYIKKAAGIVTTEILPDETLATVISRSNYSPKNIAFTEETTGTGISGKNAVLGINPATYSFSFGNMNTAQTGNYNIAWGYNSLPALTTGDSNTAVGHFSGEKVTTGRANVILGTEAATGLVGGSDNTLVGVSSGFGLKDGSGNTMLGKWTGCFITGANNTFLGYQAGQYWGKGGTGLWSSNIVIGGGTCGHSNGIWGENNVIIGSNLELIGAQNNKFIINNFLRKDNNFYKTHFIEGNFSERWLRFDTSLQVLRLPAADTSFTKNVVAKPDGTFGLEDKQTVSTDYIPLAGTTPGKPVTGTVEFSPEGGGQIKSGVGSITFEDGYTFINSTNKITGQASKLGVTQTQIILSQGSGSNIKYIHLTNDENKILVGAPVLGPGIVGTNYHGNNYEDNSFVQKRWVEERIKANIPNYKIYRALMYADRFLEPKFIVLENTLGDIVWKREDTGRYLATLQGAFPTQKTWINSKINDRSGKKYPYDCVTDIISEDAMYLHLFNCDDSSSPVDIVGQYGVIEIYAYE